MAKEMIVSVNGRERKIAVIENGQVVEFYIERGENDQGFVGNIYKGRVQRVLPGMQSAFVNIGLERDAFLYVSDFFDEEEEFERIMIEKGAKKPEAEKEVVEQLQKERLVREHQMESAHELAEPLAAGEQDDGEEETSNAAAEIVPEEDGRKGKRGGRSRGRGGKKVDDLVEAVESGADRVEAGTMFFIDEDSSFERIVDAEETTGDMFKEAYVQEAIQDKVRAIEFDVESTSSAEVGSLISSMEMGGGFERIADEDEPAFSFDKVSDEDPKEKKGGRGRGKTADKPAKGKPAAAKKPAAKGKTADKPKGKKTTKAKADKSEDSETYGDADAGVKEPSSTGEFAMRRGGRGRRRRPSGNKKETDGPTEDRLEGAESDEVVNVESEIAAAELTPVKDEAEEKEAPRKSSSRSDSRSDSRSEGRSDSRSDTRSESRPEGRSDTRSESRPEGRSDNRRDGRRGGGRSDNRRDSGRRDRPPQPTISDLLREGQEVIVQIAKEPIARKGARITSHIALPGRYIVYMPTIEHVGVSRKIESGSERTRLRTVIQKIRTEEEVPSGGFIVRTAGIGIPEAQLREDARYLVRTWVEIKKQAEKSKAPALVHQDLDLVQRILRDQLSEDFAAIRVDSEEDYLHIVEFVNRVKPHMVNRVKLYTREEPILENYGVQAEIEKALKPRVWLRSGGYLVINQTEALVAIDVNTGKFVGKGNARLEDTITKTNMEAVEEIARQIRLRDLGGILVLDLIDMEDRRNRHKVLATLQDALHRDKSPTKVLSYNDFGLIIMTRKRVKQSLERTLCTPCPYCQGSALVRSPQTICYEILEEARRLSKSMESANQVILRVHPEIANYLRTAEREVLSEIEAYLGNLDLTGDTAVHQEQYDFAIV
ncbi:MAG TPA: Rne/Rng family ribonuclease [Pyrinomonadaceae bacterium]|jgi:ribonuclease G|nr:Rne/Rng family ribonuclease [Pyrinomonadaceae bacterium]